jgi:modification methylase
MSSKIPFLNEIVCGDCIDVMSQIPDESIDIVVTSPPYNLSSKSSSIKGWKTAGLADGYDNYDDSLPHDEYVEWQRACLTEMLRLIKPTGAIFYNHKWRVKNGQFLGCEDIIEGFPLRQIIIWDRKAGFLFNKMFFLPTYEVIYLIAKPDFRLTNYGMKMRDVWQILRSRDRFGHPVPFPMEIPERCIRASDPKIVLDPFVGSGTTAVAAKKYGADYIGIDKSEKYCEIARNRLRRMLNVF